MSIVRENLMARPGYSPYCGANKCGASWPRTRFDGEQFKCVCGWRSEFPSDFIAQYVAKWTLPPAALAAKQAGKDA